MLDGAADIDLDAGRRYAARFEPAEIAGYYLAVYEQLVTARSTAVEARRDSLVRVASSLGVGTG